MGWQEKNETRDTRRENTKATQGAALRVMQKIVQLKKVVNQTLYIPPTPWPVMPLLTRHVIDVPTPRNDRFSGIGHSVLCLLCFFILSRLELPNGVCSLFWSNPLKQTLDHLTVRQCTRTQGMGKSHISHKPVTTLRIATGAVHIRKHLMLAIHLTNNGFRLTIGANHCKCSHSF